MVIRSTTWNTIFTDISAALTTLGQASPAVAGALASFPAPTFATFAKAVNFGTGTLDAATLAVSLPASITNYLINTLRLANPSASLAAGSWGLFTGPGATGVTVFPVTSTITIVTSAINANNNTLIATPTNSNTQAFNSGTLYFRVGTAVAGSADVIINIVPLY